VHTCQRTRAAGLRLLTADGQSVQCGIAPSEAGAGDDDAVPSTSAAAAVTPASTAVATGGAPSCDVAYVEALMGVVTNLIIVFTAPAADSDAVPAERWIVPQARSVAWLLSL
jgi:hypothetical protein